MTPKSKPVSGSVPELSLPGGRKRKINDFESTAEAQDLLQERREKLRKSNDQRFRQRVDRYEKRKAKESHGGLSQPNIEFVPEPFLTPEMMTNSNGLIDELDTDAAAGFEARASVDPEEAASMTTNSLEEEPKIIAMMSDQPPTETGTIVGTGGTEVKLPMEDIHALKAFGPPQVEDDGDAKNDSFADRVKKIARSQQRSDCQQATDQVKMTLCNGTPVEGDADTAAVVEACDLVSDPQDTDEVITLSILERYAVRCDDLREVQASTSKISKRSSETKTKLKMGSYYHVVDCNDMKKSEQERSFVLEVMYRNSSSRDVVRALNGLKQGRLPARGSPLRGLAKKYKQAGTKFSEAQEDRTHSSRLRDAAHSDMEKLARKSRKLKAEKSNLVREVSYSSTREMAEGTRCTD